MANLLEQVRAESFNSRARMGRDDILDKAFKGNKVSTHAPAWGAIPFQVFLSPAPGFNSRARMGRDHPNSTRGTW